jgi:hypothetical protein
MINQIDFSRGFMDIKLLRKHPVFTAIPEIGEICKPLEQLGINYFSFMRYYEDGSHIRFCNHADWLEHYYKQDFHNLVTKIPGSEGVLPWSCLQDLQSLREASEIYNINNGVMLTIPAGNTTEIYSIGSTKGDDKLNYFYLNHTDLLYKFILYFKEKAYSLIKAAQKAPILLPISSISNNSSGSETLFQEFLNAIELKNVLVTIDNNDIQLSKREGQILALMKCGLSAKEIASELNLKKRTIDIYSDKIREELSQYTRSCLLKKIAKNGLINKKWLVE